MPETKHLPHDIQPWTMWRKRWLKPEAQSNWSNAFLWNFLPSFTFWSTFDSCQLLFIWPAQNPDFCTWLLLFLALISYILVFLLQIYFKSPEPWDWVLVLCPGCWKFCLFYNVSIFHEEFPLKMWIQFLFLSHVGSLFLLGLLIKTWIPGLGVAIKQLKSLILDSGQQRNIFSL